MKTLNIKEMILLFVVAIFAVAAAACTDPVKEAEDKQMEDSLNFFLFQVLTSSGSSSSGPVDPRVRVMNSSGITQTYNLHPGNGCSSTDTITFPENPVTATSVTSYVAVSANNSYTISYNSPATGNCSNTLRSFGFGLTYTCTAGTVTVSCSVDL